MTPSFYKFLFSSAHTTVLRSLRQIRHFRNWLSLFWRAFSSRIPWPIYCILKYKLWTEGQSINCFKIWKNMDRCGQGFFFYIDISKIKTQENPRNKTSKKHKNTILAPSICQHSNMQFRVSSSKISSSAYSTRKWHVNASYSNVKEARLISSKGIYLMFIKEEWPRLIREPSSHPGLGRG